MHLFTYLKCSYGYQLVNDLSFQICLVISPGLLSIPRETMLVKSSIIYEHPHNGFDHSTGLNHAFPKIPV